MNFKYLLFVMALVTGLNAAAQTTPPKSKVTDPDSYVQSYIGLFGGLSNPIGDFKSADYNNNKSGFAKRGVTFGLDGAVYVYRNLAIGATISFQDQGEISQDDITAIATGYSESYKADGAYSSATGRYHSYSFLIGPQYSVPVLKNFIIDFRAFGGALTTETTPEYNTLLSGSTTQTSTFYQRGAKGSSLAYGGSAAIRFKAGDVVSFVVKGSYLQSEGPHLNNDNVITPTGRYLTRQPFSAIQTTLGVNFSF